MLPCSSLAYPVKKTTLVRVISSELPTLSNPNSEVGKQSHKHSKTDDSLSEDYRQSLLSKSLFFVFGAPASIFWGHVISKGEERVNDHPVQSFLVCCLPTYNDLFGTAASVF